MGDQDIKSYAERIFNDYGPTADLEALKKARQYNYLGDEENAEVWMMITDKVREMQNYGEAGRIG